MRPGPLLSQQDRDKIGELLGGLADPVRLVLFTIPSSGLVLPGRVATCETCDDAQRLIQEVTDLSDKLTLEVHHFEREPDEARRYGVDRVPSLLVLGPEDGSVRYAGAPFGHEFALLLQDIQLVSQGVTRLSEETREALGTITEPIDIQVFVTPT